MLWLALILLFLVAAAWIVCLAASLPLWIAIVVTVVALVAFVVVLVVRRVRAALRAAALERELLKQAAQQADQVRPDRRAEILALQAQMKAAIESLKRSKLGSSGGTSALYALPWYVIVGPPAAGKTTALEQSGLAFAAPRGAGSKVRGTAGTRNCDWWFSREAILLDTAGRFSVEEDDRDEWFAFLDTIKRFRPRRPLDGVVVALSVEELLGASETVLEEMAAKLRARVDEINGKLEIVLPLYVMLTKADLIAGFIEFFGDFNKTQRAQAWGATFALEDERLTEPARAVEGEVDLMIQALHARLLERLARERAPEARARILQFPLEFASIRAPLARFLEELSRQTPYEETPFLRGFYFTSGTQTGRPMDRVLQGMARGFDLQLAPPQNPAPTQPQSYFVTELFRNIVFPDRHTAVFSGKRLKRRARSQGLVAGGVVATTALIAAPSAISYVDNVRLVNSTARDVRQATARVTGTEANPAQELDRLLDRLKLLERESSRFHVAAWWGPHAAPDLHAGVQKTYLERLRGVMEGPVRAHSTSSVRAVGDLVRADAQNFQWAYRDLKLHLMLCLPERLDQKWVAEELVRVYADALRDQKPDTERAKLHARYYVEALAANREWFWTPDAGIVTRAQGRLAFLPLDELTYGWLVDAAKGTPPIRPEKIFYGAAAQYVSSPANVEVPGMYTYLGWEKVRTLLASPELMLSIEPWVLGRAREDAEEAQAGNKERLRELYFRRYVAAWTDFLAGVEVKTPEDVKTGIDELRVIAESDGPYSRLFRSVSENVRLDLEDQTLLGKGKEAAEGALAKLTGQDAGPPERKISPVERHFEQLLTFGFGEAATSKGDAPPSKLSQYLAQLSTLEVALSQLSESKSEPTAEFETELSRTVIAVERLLTGLDPTTRRLLEPLLMNPIRGSRAGVVSADYAALEDKWKTEVWEPYASKLVTRFPFVDVPTDITLAEFGEFFRPEAGILWKFYKENLEERLERSGSTFTPRQSAVSVPFRPDFLKCLSVAQEITDAAFGNLPEPSVPFAVRLHSAGTDISEITLRIDGDAIVYRNEPERWIPAKWPGGGSPKGGTLQVRGARFTDEIPRAGDFGLFRLLQAGGVKPGASSEGAPVMVATWSLTRPGEPPVSIDFKPSKSGHPFSPNFFRRLRCPAAVSMGAPPPQGGR